MGDNIEEIVLDNQLFDYIRGEKRYKNIRPDVDYSRWAHISKHLTESKNHRVKNEIVRLLLELLNSNDWHDHYSVAGICLNIDMPEIDRKFEQNILKPIFLTFPDTFISFASKYAMKKRLNFANKLVVENAIKKNHIDWIFTSVSSDVEEQGNYWSYCDKTVREVLSEIHDIEKTKIYERILICKEETMIFINRLSDLRGNRN